MVEGVNSLRLVLLASSLNEGAKSCAPCERGEGHEVARGFIKERQESPLARYTRHSPFHKGDEENDPFTREARGMRRKNLTKPQRGGGYASSAYSPP